jgi:hypothetical protein
MQLRSHSAGHLATQLTATSSDVDSDGTSHESSDLGDGSSDDDESLSSSSGDDDDIAVEPADADEDDATVAQWRRNSYSASTLVLFSSSFSFICATLAHL